MRDALLSLFTSLMIFTNVSYAAKTSQKKPVNYSAEICQGGLISAPKTVLSSLDSKTLPFYQDLLDRCQSYISRLTTAQELADRISLTGDLMKAASVMKNAILTEANGLPPPFAGGANPHTIESIRVAASIVNRVYSGTESALPKLGSMLVGQIRFLVLQNAINLIRHAYVNLDAYHFLSNVNTCYRGCQTQRLPFDYFDGVKNLALSYLRFQEGPGRETADDRVELFMAQAMISAAKETLARSLSRRELACAVSDLHKLEGEVTSAVCTSNYGLPISDSVGYVRNEIQRIISEIEYLGYGGCQSSSHGPW